VLFRSIADVLDAYSEVLDHKPMLIGHGITGDMKMLRGELRRAGRPDRFEDTSNYYCTMRKSTGWCKLPSPSGRGYKWPKLGEAYQHFFKETLEGAHDALVDAMAVRRIYLRMRMLSEPSLASQAPLGDANG